MLENHCYLLHHQLLLSNYLLRVNLMIYEPSVMKTAIPQKLFSQINWVHDKPLYPVEDAAILIHLSKNTSSPEIAW